VKGLADLDTVGDAGTLAGLSGMSVATAKKVMAWATAAEKRVAPVRGVVVETADVVYCVHCRTKQPKDYKSGDLCPSCGQQAEPTLVCFWCSASGPGRFCRQCAAEFVPTGELELALLLKREGLAKDEIPGKLRELTAEEKEALWGRVRKHRG